MAHKVTISQSLIESITDKVREYADGIFEGGEIEATEGNISVVVSFCMDSWADPYVGNWYEDGPSGYGESHYEIWLDDATAWVIEDDKDDKEVEIANYAAISDAVGKIRR